MNLCLYTMSATVTVGRVILIFGPIIAIAVICIYGTERFFKYLENRKRQEKIDFKPELNVNFDNMKEKDIETLKLEELRKIYIQLIDVENKIDKTNEHLKEIVNNTSIIMFVIVVPFIIGVILKLIGVDILSNLLF